MSFDISKLKEQIDNADFMKTTTISLNVEYCKELLDYVEKLNGEEKREIFILKKMLEKENIPFIFRNHNLFSTYQILIRNREDEEEILLDVIDCYGFDCNNNSLEILGGMTLKEFGRDNVLNNLTAEEVFKRIKYCYENNTFIYVKEEED